MPDARPEVTEVYRRVLGLRRRHPWLVDARVEATEVTNTSAVLVATPRAADAEERPLRLVLNLGDDALALPDGEVLEAGAPSTATPSRPTPGRSSRAEGLRGRFTTVCQPNQRFPR